MQTDAAQLPETEVAFTPTDARPGSPEKLAVLEQRARLGQPLWHPGDKQGPILHSPILQRYKPPEGWHPLGHLFAGYK